MKGSRNKPAKRLSMLILSAALALSLVTVSEPVKAKAAAGLPDDLVTVWDMENIPDDLFDGGMALSQEDSTGGHSYGYTDAVKAAGKGVDGSAAAGLRYNAECPGSQLWASGWHLALYKDPTADSDWFGVKEVWFYIDISEFSAADPYLDFMVDGMKPEIGRQCWTVRNGSRREAVTEPSYVGATNGRIRLTTGFKGWVGISAGAFNSTFGNIKTVSFSIEPSSDVARFPLTMYVDEISIVKEDMSSSVLMPSGELFNQGTDKGSFVLTVDTSEHFQKVKDFGASGAWWAPYMGESPFVDEALRLIFSDEGAGLNGYRHNVGSSVKSDHSDAGTPTGGRSPLSPLTEEGTYDETRDPGSMAVLQKLKEMGTIDMWVMFMNSPPSTMTNNAMTNGDAWGETLSNLRADCHEAYVNYVVDMVQLFNYLGYPFDYVSPINEPQWDWTGTNQEGCHYSADEVLEIDTMVVEELNRRREQDPTIITRLSASESANWTDKSYVNYFFLKLLSNETLRTNIDHFAAHSYGASAAAKERMMNEIKGMSIPLAMKETEYGPGFAYPDFSINTALDVARVIYEDLTIINVDSWTYWRAVGNGNFTDSLAYGNRDGNLVIPAKRLWAMGQYARFIKGATRVAAYEGNMPAKIYSSAYVNPDDDQIIVIVVNEGKEDKTFSIEGIKAGSTAQVWETSAIRDLGSRGTMTVDSGYTLPAQSITTFVFDGQGIDKASFEDRKDPGEEQTAPAGDDAAADGSKAAQPDNSDAQPDDSDAQTQPADDAAAQPAAKRSSLWIVGMAVGAVLIIGSVTGLVITARRRKESK
ncbi:MAG: glycoside hydrolase family 30 protein [Lachnospiraceae bacterium]|nr:glycoside hydrolase family 30 protein [Lachnospiraceae bacterium]